MRLSELLPLHEGERRNVEDDELVAGFTERAEAVAPGVLFFARLGRRTDGRALAGAALGRGALAVVTDDPLTFVNSAKAVLVADVRRTFAAVAARFNGCPGDSLRLVGITGTNGKTSVGFLLRHILRESGREVGLVGGAEHALNGAEVDASRGLTTPTADVLHRQLAQMRDAGVTDAIIEASSIGLDQERAGALTFKVALFTNLTHDHLDYHGSFERYFEAKRRLFRGPKLDAAVIWSGQTWGRRLLRETTARRIFTYGFDADAAFGVSELSLSEGGSRGQLVTPDGPCALELPFPAEHNVLNALGAIAAAYALGVEPAIAARALKSATLPPGRLEKVHGAAQGARATETTGPRVFVDFAHSPDALERTLAWARRQLRPGSGGRVIVVCGCGGERDASKRQPTGAIASRLADLAVITSEHPRGEAVAAIIDAIASGAEPGRDVLREPDRAAAIRRALSAAKPEDVVIVTGVSHERLQHVAGGDVSFDDRGIIESFYDSLH